MLVLNIYSNNETTWQGIMGKIVAIGGGGIGRSGYLGDKWDKVFDEYCERHGLDKKTSYRVETTEIDKEIIGLAGKPSPRLLFIPTASSDAESYVNAVKGHFGRTLKCEIDILYLIKERPTKEAIEAKILSSDIIYVGGGNTLKMMKLWREYGLDEILQQAYQNGIVLSGISAGAICWFRYGNSDSRKFANPDAGLIKVSGLNFINTLFCPHYDVEKDRKLDLKKMMKKTPGMAVAIDNCCAIEIVDDQYRIISSKAKGNAYRVYWKKGNFHHEIIEKKKEFLPLKELLMK